MHILTLVVTSDADERARLTLLFEPAAGDRTRDRNGGDIVLAAMADAVITTDAACRLAVRSRREMLGARIVDTMALHDAAPVATIEHPTRRVLSDRQAIGLPPGQALLRAVLSIASNLALPAVAEGIETTDEANYLMNAGCRLGQGFLYSPPVSAAAFERLASR